MGTSQRKIVLKLSKAYWFLCIVLVLPACTQKQPLFYWGEYEEVLYDMYIKAGDADPSTQIVILTEQINLAVSENKRVAPGIYAHLGYMYHSQGQTDQAIEYYLQEKQLYPESSRFIDNLIGKEAE